MLDRVRAGDGGGRLGGSPGVSSCVTATMVLRQVAKWDFLGERQMSDFDGYTAGIVIK